MAFSRTQLIPMIVSVPVFMQNLDTSILATALPVISHSISVDPLRLNLAITSYLLSLAVFIPLSGWLSDKFGTRTVFRLAVILFTVGSVFCGMANGLWELVAARILQGMGGAMMVPVARLILFKSIPKDQLVNAMVWFTTPSLVGPVLGAPIGGFIVTYFSWRWIFYINVPIGLIAILCINIFIENSQDSEGAHLDIPSFLLMGLSLSGLLFGLENVGRDIVPLWVTISLLVGGAICLGLYLLYVREAERPVIDLKLFERPVFRRTVVGGFLFRIMLGATPFLLPLMLQLGFGLSPLTSGSITFASAAGSISMRLGLRQLLRRFGFRRMLIVGCIASALIFMGSGLFTPATPHAVIFLVLLIGGLVRSLVMTGMLTLTFADIPPTHLSRATALSAVTQQISLSLGVAITALTLNITRNLHGQTALGPDDFWPAFVVIGLICSTALFCFVALKPDDGDDITGHKHQA